MVNGASDFFMNIQKCSKVFSESDFGAILEGPEAPGVVFFLNSCSGFAVFKKARISRVLEAILFSRFSVNSKVLFSQTVEPFCCFSEFEGSWSARLFQNVGLPAGSFLIQL